MEFVGISRVLWRRRLAVGCGALVALAIAVFGVYRISLLPPGLHGRSTASGFAVERVLVNTPKSLLAEARPHGTASIVTKAGLLGGALTSGGVQRSIATAAGLAPAELVVTDAAQAIPQVPTDLALQALKVSKPLAPYMVAVSQDPDLPVLSISASAPTAAAAARLAAAATGALAAASEQVLAIGGGVKMEPVGKPVVGTKVLTTGKAKPVAVAIFALLAWCVAIALFDAVGRPRRRLPNLRRGFAVPTGKFER